MRQLLLIKEQIKKFVGKNEVFILPILKFVLTFLALSKLNSSLGYMKVLTNGAITLIVALAGSFLPVNLTLVILAGIALAHVYAISFEATILVGVLFLVLFLLYFRFASKDSVAVLLVPLSFIYKVPYVMPVSMGLVGTPSSMVSTACGVIVYHVLHYISENASSLSQVTIDTKDVSAFKGLVDSILNNKAMIVFTIAFAATVLVVYIIRRLPIAYSWFIAIATGTMADFILILMFNSKLNAGIAIGSAFLGALVSIIINLILQYFCFDLDYNKVEKVQFEDDEYYYYVKAVPKNTIKLSDNGRKKKAVKAEKTVAPATKPLRGDDMVQERPVSRPVRALDTEEDDVKVANPARAREVVRKTATREVKRTSQRGPLGMSGGRPAGEGRKIEKNGESD